MSTSGTLASSLVLMKSWLSLGGPRSTQIPSCKSVTETEEPSFPSLPNDIWYLIFQQCMEVPNDLLQVNTVSKKFHALSLPLVYRNVDLSIHNLVLKPEGEGIKARNFRYDSAEVIWRDPCEQEGRVVRRQKKFLSCLLRNPERGRFVQGFTWTLIFDATEGERWRCVGDFPTTHTWQVFEMLENVQTLDFASHFYEWWDPYAQCHPEALFPTATSIRLSGVMSQSFAQSFFQHRPSRFTQISIHDLQHVGTLSDGYILESCHLGEPRWRLPLPSGSNAPGPLRGILKTMPSGSPLHAPRLKSLHLLKVGHFSNKNPGFVSEADIEVYNEWANFLKHVAPTVEELCFEQWPHMLGHWYRGSDYRAPMYVRFEEYLLPTFLNHSWPRLKCLKLVGFGNSPSASGFIDIEHALRMKLGPSVALTLRPTTPVRALWTGVHENCTGPPPFPLT